MNPRDRARLEAVLPFAGLYAHETPQSLRSPHSLGEWLALSQQSRREHLGRLFGESAPSARERKRAQRRRG